MSFADRGRMDEMGCVLFVKLIHCETVAESCETSGPIGAEMNEIVVQPPPCPLR